MFDYQIEASFRQNLPMGGCVRLPDTGRHEFITDCLNPLLTNTIVGLGLPSNMSSASSRCSMMARRTSSCVRKSNKSVIRSNHGRPPTPPWFTESTLLKEASVVLGTVLSSLRLVHVLKGGCAGQSLTLIPVRRNINDQFRWVYVFRSGEHGGVGNDVEWWPIVKESFMFPMVFERTTSGIGGVRSEYEHDRLFWLVLTTKIFSNTGSGILWDSITA